MQAQFRHGTCLARPYTPVTAKAAGEIVVAAKSCSVVPLALAAGELGDIRLPTGTAVYRLPKAASSGVTFVRGAPVYWTGTTTTGTAGTNGYFGSAADDAADAADYVEVLHGGPLITQ